MTKYNKIVAIGDSLTYGYLLRDEDRKWTNILSKKIGIEIINKGINGDTTEDISFRFERDVLRIKPDIAFIWCGVNDFFMGVSFEQVISNISEFYQKCVDNNIKPVLISSTPVNTNGFDTYQDYIKNSVDDKLSNLAKCFKEKGFVFIDMYNFFKEKEEDNDYIEYFIDSVHLSYKANEFVAEMIYDNMKKLGFI